MIYDVNITKSAKQDILDAAIYISQKLFNNAAANRLLDNADLAATSLSQNPMIRPLVYDDFLASKGIRSLSVGNYLMLYVVYEETNKVDVIRFIHSRRDWVSILTNDINDN